MSYVLSLSVITGTGHFLWISHYQIVKKLVMEYVFIIKDMKLFFTRKRVQMQIYH